MTRILLMALIVVSSACSKDESKASAPATTAEKAPPTGPGAAAATPTPAPRETRPASPAEEVAEPIPREAPAAGAGAPAAAAALSPDIEKVVTEAIALTSELGDLLQANQDDCAKAAAALSKFVAANQGKFQAMREALAKAPIDQQRASMQKFGTEMGQIMMKKVAPVQLKCNGNAEFVKAYSSMRM